MKLDLFALILFQAMQVYPWGKASHFRKDIINSCQLAPACSIIFFFNAAKKDALARLYEHTFLKEMLHCEANSFVKS